MLQIYLLQLSTDMIDWKAIATCAQTPPQAKRIPLMLVNDCIGSVAMIDAAGLADCHPKVSLHSDKLQIDCTADEASAALAALAQHLKAAGHLKAWRNELLPVTALPQAGQPYGFYPPLATVERGAARRLGILTHAVHLTGITHTGDIWLQRRAMNKATDPGMLDTLAGGLVAYGDTLVSGVLRETYEEAGLTPEQFSPPLAHGAILVSHPVPEGQMIELAWSYSAHLAPNTVPHNLDGEVSDFCCLSKTQVIDCIKNHELAFEAVLTMGLAWGALKPDTPAQAA